MIENWINLIERQPENCTVTLFQNGEEMAKSLEPMTFGEALRQGVQIIFADPSITYIITCTTGIPA